MLVLSRRQSDQIVIPALGITLKVISIRGNSVKLGFDAPADVANLRGELAKQIEQDEAYSAKSSVPTPPAKGSVKSALGLKRYLPAARSYSASVRFPSSAISTEFQADESALTDGGNQDEQVREGQAIYQLTF